MFRENREKGEKLLVIFKFLAKDPFKKLKFKKLQQLTTHAN